MKAFVLAVRNNMLTLLPLSFGIAVAILVIVVPHVYSAWGIAGRTEALEDSRTRLTRSEKVYEAKLAELNKGSFYHKMWLIVMRERGEDLEVESALRDVDYLWGRMPSINPIGVRNASGIGWRPDPITGFSAYHRGCDLPAQYGLPVYATADGEVVRAEYGLGGYGNVVGIDHGNGYYTLYAHCSELVVLVGDEVEKGDMIAKVGASGRATGSHLHYEVRVDNVPVNPMNYIVAGRIE